MLFNHAVDISGTEPNPRWIQDAICTTQEQDLLSDGMDLDEITMCPDVWEPRIISLLVSTTIRITPEEHGLVWETGCSNQFARHAILHCFSWTLFNRGIVDFEFGAEGRALAAAHIHRFQWILLAETAGQIGAAGDVHQVDEFGEANVVEPFEEGVGEDHAGRGDGTKCGEIHDLAGGDIILRQFVEVAGRGAKVGDSKEGILLVVGHQW